MIGYYALVAGSVRPEEAPARISKGLAKHPIGVILLARLAVDTREKGKGVGKALLKDALLRIVSAADTIGARAVLVHAIDEEARRFYERFDFERSPVDEFELMLLMKDLRAGSIENHLCCGRGCVERDQDPKDSVERMRRGGVVVLCRRDHVGQRVGRRV